MSVTNFPEGWNYKTPILLSGGSLISGNVTNHIQKLNFSCLSLGSNPNDVFTGEKRADHFGEDIVFTLDSAGTIILDWSFQYFNWATNEVWIDVRIPTYTTSSFYIYYWRSKWKESLIPRTSAYGSDAVWVDYARVVHLNTKTGGSTSETDWSPYNNQFCQYKDTLPNSDSGQTIWSSAPCFRPQTTIGGGNRVSIGSVTLQPTADDSFGCGGWFAPFDFTNNRYVWGKRNGSSGDGWALRILTTGKLRFICHTSTADYNMDTDNSVIITANTWYHIWVTYDGSRSSNGVKIYVNGISVAISINAGSWPIVGNPTNGVNFAIGGIEGDNNTETFRGGYQEFRYVRGSVKSSDYIKLMYETQKNLSTYATPEATIFVGKTVANDWDFSESFCVKTKPENISSSEVNFMGKINSDLIPADKLSTFDVNKVRVTSDASGINEIPFYAETTGIGGNINVWFLIPDMNNSISKRFYFWPKLKIDSDEKQPIPTRDSGSQNLVQYGTQKLFTPMDAQNSDTVNLNLALYDESMGRFQGGLPNELSMDTPAQEFFAVNDGGIYYDGQIGGLGSSGELFKKPFSLSFVTQVLDPNVDYAFMAMVEMSTYKGFSVRVSRDGAANKNVYFVLRAGNNPNNCIIVHGDTALAAYTPNHVAVEWDGSQSASNVKMYVDGVLQTLTIINDTLPVSTPNLTIPFTLGIRGTDRELEGGLDSCKFTHNKNFGANWYLLEYKNYFAPNDLYELVPSNQDLDLRGGFKNFKGGFL